MRPLSRDHRGTGAGQNQARQRPCTGWLNLLASTLPLTARLSALLLTLGVAVVGAPHVRADSVDEARLQAAFVAKFPAFVQWPASAFSDRGALTICVCRSERAAAYLRELVAGEQVGGRPLTVRAVDTAPQLRGCHVLFVPEPADAGMVAAVSARPVLTIGLQRDFLEAGGIIALHRDERRMRFEVDRDAAARAGLQLSSQLLRLAVSVRGDRR